MLFFDTSFNTFDSILLGFRNANVKKWKIISNLPVLNFHQIHIIITSHQRVNLGKVISTRSLHQYSQIQHWNFMCLEFKTTRGHWIQYLHEVFRSLKPLKALTLIPRFGLFVLKGLDFNTHCRPFSLKPQSTQTFGPRLATFGPRLATFWPRLATFGPRLAIFLPRLETFGPRLATFGSKLATFGPR